MNCTKLQHLAKDGRKSFFYRVRKAADCRSVILKIASHCWEISENGIDQPSEAETKVRKNILKLFVSWPESEESLEEISTVQCSGSWCRCLWYLFARQEGAKKWWAPAVVIQRPPTFTEDGERRYVCVVRALQQTTAHDVLIQGFVYTKFINVLLFLHLFSIYD